MKILHVIEKMGPGGAEKLLDETLPIFVEKFGIKVDLLVLNDNEEENIFLRKIRDKSIKVIHSPYKNTRSLKNILFISDLIKNENYQIVHSHLFPSNYFVSMISRFDKSNRIYITTEHNTNNRRRNKKIFKPIERYIYGGYDKIINITEGTRDNLMKWLNVNSFEKFSIVYNGINLDDFKFAKSYSKYELLGKDDKKIKTIGMIGSFSKQKDQKTIIKSLNKLEDHVHLVLVGDGPEKSALQNLAGEIGVESRVHFLGIRDDVPRIYQTIDIAVVSSNWEGFGLVAAEAMACSKPVIASNVEGLREVVEDAGILFKKNNSNDLAEKIQELLDNKALYEKISQNCYMRSKRYDINNMAGKVVEIYQELIMED